MKKKIKFRLAKTQEQIDNCIKFISSDPIKNLLLLGDLYPPLSKVSTIHFTRDKYNIRGVCSILNLLDVPSVIVSGINNDVIHELLEHSINTVKDRFLTICEEDKVKVFREFGDIKERYKEQQMILMDKSKLKQNQYAEKITDKDYNAINEFFSTHEAPAWNPLHLKTGPYYVIRCDNKIVSAAGTHFLTPQIGQIGNVTTDKNYRKQGFASVCCSAVANEILSKNALVSLFVETENTAAVYMYKNLGFVKVRDLSFVILEKH